MPPYAPSGIVAAGLAHQAAVDEMGTAVPCVSPGNATGGASTFFVADAGAVVVYQPRHGGTGTRYRCDDQTKHGPSLLGASASKAAWALVSHSPTKGT